MAVAYVQSKGGSTTVDAATVAATFDAPVGSGNLVVGIVWWQDATDSLTSVTDNQSNTYTIQRQILDIEGNARSAAVFYKENITNAPTILTANFSPDVLGTIAFMEASGVATASALDKETGQTQSNPGTGPNAVSSGATAVTAEDDEFIFGASVQAFNAATGPLFAAGTNYTERQEVGGSGPSGGLLSIEHRTLGAAAAVTATFTWSGAADDFATFVMTFKASGEAPPPDTVTWVGYIG